jgi:hypothetical protein
MARVECEVEFIQAENLAILDLTWQKVSKRDWVTNPNNAHEVAENG